MKKLYVLFLTFMLVSAVTHAGMEVTTADGSGADTYVGNDSAKGPNINYGASTTVSVRHYAGTREQMTYVKFDLGDVTGGDLTGAQLELTITTGGATRTWNIYGLNDNEVDDAWSESSITYNTAPGMAPATLGSYAIDATKLTLIGTLVVPNTGVPFVVTSNTTSLNMDSFLAADTNGLVTLVMIATGSDRQYWVAAKEGLAANPTWSAPTLILPNAIPEPVTMVLLGLGSLLTLGKKRSH